MQGFQVSGRVLESENGLGLSNVKLFLNDKAVTTTSEGGFYVLENVKTGTYHLTAESGWCTINLNFVLNHSAAV